jgi:WD40 repeat protein
MNSPFPSPGPLAIPDHRLVRLIARGSYGEVWLAHNTLGTPRAVKLVHRQTFDSERPFQREFEGIRRFEPISRSHEGFVQVLHVGRNDEAGFFYYVMELADNARPESARPAVELSGPPAGTDSVDLAAADYVARTLASDIRTHGRLPIARCIEVSLALTSALGHLHKAGLVHRDIKPSNIIFVGGLPKIADIGLVSGFGESRSFVGTEGFVPPEGPGTPVADLYSLGKALYEMSTGKDREHFPEIPSEWLDLSPPARELEFHEIVGKACEGRPEARYASAEEMHADLSLLQSGRSVRRLRSMERRLVRMNQLGVAAVALLILALGGSWFFRHQAARDRENFQRIAAAEREARRQLWNSLVAQSQAVRANPTAGRRFASLDLVRRAAALDIDGNRLTLRNEVAASLAAPDLRSISVWSHPAITNDLSVLDLEHERAFALTRDGRVVVYSLTNSLATAELANAGNPLQQLWNVSPDGRRLVALARSQRIAIWSIDEGRLLWTSPPASRRSAARFTPDGRELALYIGATGELSFHDVDGAAAPVRVVHVPLIAGFVGLRLSPDGRRAAIGGISTNAVFIVDTQTGATLHRLELPMGLSAFDWQSNGPLLATSCDDRKIRVWETQTGRLHALLAGHAGLAITLAFAPSNEFLASSSYDGTTRLWNLQTGESVARLPQAGVHLNFDRSGKRLAFLPWTAREVQLCQVATDRICRQLPPALSPFAAAQSQPLTRGLASDVCSDEDERWLASGGEDGLRLWETATRRLILHTNIGRTATVRFERGDKAILTVGERGVLRWPLSRMASDEAPILDAPSKLANSQHDSRGTWNAAGDVFSWMDSGQNLVQDAAGTIHPVPTRQPATQVAISPDGRWLATAAFNVAGARVWELNTTPNLVRDIPTRVGPSLAFTPDGAWLVLGTEREFAFWDYRNGQRHLSVARSDAAGLSGPMAFSPDGKTMAIAATRTLIRLVDWKTGRELVTLESPSPSAISRLNFTARGGVLAASVGDGMVELWDLRALRRELAAMKLDW